MFCLTEALTGREVFQVREEAFLYGNILVVPFFM